MISLLMFDRMSDGSYSTNAQFILADDLNAFVEEELASWNYDRAEEDELMCTTHEDDHWINPEPGFTFDIYDNNLDVLRKFIVIGNGDEVTIES